MDNRTIDVVSSGLDGLKMALGVIWPNAAGSRAVSYKVTNFIDDTTYYGKPETSHHVASLKIDDAGTKTLILYWHEEEDYQPLPYVMDLDDTLSFVKGWLKSADYGPAPDIDGDSDKAWRVFTEQWGHVAGSSYAICAIQPAWAMYGK